MDKYIDSRFERLEKALAGLIDSVNKYHPSSVQAKELEAADNELSRGLEEVQTHQNNYLRIQELRKSSSALDAQIRETLSSLAATRKDIVSTHTTTFPSAPNHPIRYEELLRYARYVSKTSMPTASMMRAVAADAAANAPAASGDATPTSPETQTPQPQSAVTPSAAATPSQPQSPGVNGTSGDAATTLLSGGGSGAQVQSQQTTQTTASVIPSLPESIVRFMDPLLGQVFLPWPSEDNIRTGTLASNQRLIDQGIDLKGFDPVAEEERKVREEEERKAQEEKQRQEQEERERRIMEERERQRQERARQMERQQEDWRRASMAGEAPGSSGTAQGSPAAVDKKQFQFAGGDDDLDDDDDDE